MEKNMGTLIDASTEQTMDVVVPSERATEEVIEMVMGDDDLIYGSDLIGRMSHGFDISDFDLMARDRIYETPNMSEGPAGDELDLMAGDDEEPMMFQAPETEAFPVFKQAMREFSAESRPKIVRVDTEDSYGEFVADQAADELARRVTALEASLYGHLDDENAHRVGRIMDAFREHAEDPYAHKRRVAKRLQNDEVMGAAQAVADLRQAATPEEALNAMPQVPVDLPTFAEGKVKCWKDGDHVVCSMRFSAADGKVRIATMAAKPCVDEAAIESWAMQSGVDPVTLLGVLPDLADVACGKRLVRDTARAAVKAQERDDVLGQEDEPVLLASRKESNPALAALMYLQQRAEAGDEQAEEEIGMIRLVARTPRGRVAAPLLVEANHRLLAGKAKKAAEPKFLKSYINAGMCL